MQVEKAVKLPTFYAEDTAASANEVWSRLHSDPLFAVSGLPLMMSSMMHPAREACLSDRIQGWSIFCG